MTRLLVNDCLSVLSEHRTFWNDLCDWFHMSFRGGEYPVLAELAAKEATGASLIVRNATYFPPMATSVPTISLLQDIVAEGPMRKMQTEVFASSTRVVANSTYTLNRYPELAAPKTVVIPLPVDFDTFEIGNPMGHQQALSLPDGCIAWVGAHESAGSVKGWDIFQSVVRANPDLHFCAVFKDSIPASIPPNMRAYAKLTHAELADLLGACRVGLCTSRTETQHLAGIEMGACGLPLVAPEVGAYWRRSDMPGVIVGDPTPASYTAAVRAALSQPSDPDRVREYWEKEFAPGIIFNAWSKLITEVECSSAS